MFCCYSCCRNSCWKCGKHCCRCGNFNCSVLAMKINNFNIALISILLAVVGITILYINPGNPINRLLFFVSTSFAGTIHLLRNKKVSDISFFRKKRNVVCLVIIVLSGGISVYLFLFSSYKRDAVAYIALIVFITLVILFIIKVRKRTNHGNKQNNV